VTWVLVAVGAALGAPIRYLAGHIFDDGFPTGTLVVNVVGSMLLGVFASQSLDSDAAALLGTGFCGALTTYSAFVVQTHDHGPRIGVPYAALSIGLCFLGAVIGYWLL
jgi:CrcB protein